MSFSHLTLKNLISIRDSLGYVATLQIGRHAALLFDTVAALVDLCSYLKTLTELPVIVVLIMPILIIWAEPFYSMKSIYQNKKLLLCKCILIKRSVDRSSMMPERKTIVLI